MRKLSNYIKENKLKYSDQRERVLKILYFEHYPVTIGYLVKKLNDETLGVGYTTVYRHLKFFEKLNMLTVINKTQKGYLLKEQKRISKLMIKCQLNTF